ncbi:FecR family protein [Flavitalea flava]
MAESQRIAFLLFKHLQGALNEEEKEELSRWKNQSSLHRVLFEETDREESFREDLAEYSEANSKQLEKRIFEKFQAQIDAETRAVPIIPLPVIPSVSLRIRRWKGAAAALFILALGTGAYFLTFYRQHKDLATKDSRPSPVKNDMPPGGNKAILTLADGSAIVLDEAKNGKLAGQGNANIIKKDNALAYTLNGGKAKAEFNQISTPVGGQYQVVLSDGTKVWLNASSSLRFPTVFNGKDRTVEITGEVYFEVKKNVSLPFRVKAGELAVEVLGTSFDVMAYKEESSINTTLVEGSVRVIHREAQKQLQPGEQANLNKTTGAIRVAEMDVEEAIAWKNGFFLFNDASVETLMRQISRWYGVEIQYEGPMPMKQIRGKAPRNTNLAELLKVLELSGVHARLEGEKIFVIPG